MDPMLDHGRGCRHAFKIADEFGDVGIRAGVSRPRRVRPRALWLGARVPRVRDILDPVAASEHGRGCGTQVCGHARARSSYRRPGPCQGRGWSRSEVVSC